MTREIVSQQPLGITLMTMTLAPAWAIWPTDLEQATAAIVTSNDAEFSQLTVATGIVTNHTQARMHLSKADGVDLGIGS